MTISKRFGQKLGILATTLGQIFKEIKKVRKKMTNVSIYKYRVLNTR